MARTLQWEHCPKKGDLTVDPYTSWLDVSRRNSIDFARYTSKPLTKRDGRLILHALTLSSGNVDPTRPPNGAVLRWTYANGDAAQKVAQIALVEQDIEEIPMQSVSPFADLAADGSAVDMVETYSQFAPLDEVSVPSAVDTLQDPGYTAPAGIQPEKVVITAVIDDNINLAHERFVDQHGNSRVDFAWLQDGDAVPDGTDSPVLFGREIRREEIDHARSAGQSEDQILRKLGLLDFSTSDRYGLAQRFSHGTYVLDKAAGYPSDERLYRDAATPAENCGASPVDRRIIAVQLPRRVTIETSGALYSLFVVAGLRYIFNRALAIARELGGDRNKIPIVINFSYGLAGGPHNGKQLIERAVDQICKEVDRTAHQTVLGPAVVPMATGNRFLQNSHASVQAAAADETTLKLLWQTQPQDKSPNYMEIWVPATAWDKTLRLSLKHLSSPEVPDQVLHLDLDKDIPQHGGEPMLEAYCLVDPAIDDDTRLLGRVSVDRLDASQFPFVQEKDKIRILIALAPTHPVTDLAKALPPGVWEIAATLPLDAGDWIEAWIQRDDTPPGYTRGGRGSWLIDQSWTYEQQTERELNENVQPLPPHAGLNRYGTISGISTEGQMIRVAGSRYWEGHLPALYSGASSANILAPDLCAPSDRSRVFGGILGASSRSGGSLAINGTSVSAPLVARAAADLLSIARYRNMLSGEARSHVLEACTEVVPLPDTRAGNYYTQNPEPRKLRGRDKVLKDSVLAPNGSLRR